MKFKLPIGDWSDDGHGKCEWFYVVTNAKTIEEVREAYFKAIEITGIDFSKEMASEYDSGLEDEDIERLRAAGIEVPEEHYVTDEFALLFLAWLKKGNEALTYEIDSDETPTLTFYGNDDQRRHIGFIGYGLFQ